MQSQKRRITRDACSLGVIALAWAVGAGGSYAQDTPPGVVPGLYTDSRCDAANFPAEMPAVNAVLDSSTLVAALPRLGLDKSLVLTLRLGSLSHDPRVRVFKKKGSTQVAERIADTVASALRGPPVTEPWGFRLRIEPGAVTALTLERSEFCPPTYGIPAEKHLANAVATVSADQLRRGNGQAEIERQLARNAPPPHPAPRLRVLVGPDGKVLDAAIVKSSGAATDSEALQRVRTQNFTAANLDGRPVGAWIEIGG